MDCNHSCRNFSTNIIVMFMGTLRLFSSLLQFVASTLKCSHMGGESKIGTSLSTFLDSVETLCQVIQQKKTPLLVTTNASTLTFCVLTRESGFPGFPVHPTLALMMVGLGSKMPCIFLKAGMTKRLQVTTADTGFPRTDRQRERGQRQQKKGREIYE